MIKHSEIQRLAIENGVPDTQIEKDYVLSWILTGISKTDLANSLVFKGGTVLKKFYFEDYRFSEDLDFTLLNKDLDNESIKSELLKAFDIVSEEANINLFLVDFDQYKTGGIHCFIGYEATLGGKDKKLKIDISKDEILQFDTVSKKMFQTYSDSIECAMQCYSLPEILTEKMRSIIQRQQPRDYYDIWYLCEKADMEMQDYISEFKQKALYKKVAANNFEYRINTMSSSVKSQWDKFLIKQIKNLPPFVQIERELLRHVRGLSKELKKQNLKS